jgi:para-aminobenzoate synthetase component 2
MILLIDNYDSFTYNLVDYIEQLNIACEVLQNDNPDILSLDLSRFEAVILSPGPGTPENSGFLMPFIEKYINDIPILGICLGHQALGQFFGMKLIKNTKPVHGKISLVNHNEKGPFQGLKNPMTACRYHSLVLVNDENSEIRITATADEEEIMAIEHISLPVYGIQFHPEAILTLEGKELLWNWIQQNTREASLLS